jgi:ketosteroid isomerase-like protein
MKNLTRVKQAFVLFFALAVLVPGGAMAGNLERSKEFFDKLSSSNMNLVEGFYDKDAVFQDPVHQLKGVPAIRAYYEGLYKNVEAIRFEYGKSIESGDMVSLTWRMYLKASGIEGGKEITVDGVSVITFGGKEGKAVMHRDYFDMGEFVYERVPVLKSVVAYIKKRLAGN